MTKNPLLTVLAASLTVASLLTGCASDEAAAPDVLTHLEPGTQPIVLGGAAPEMDAVLTQSDAKAAPAGTRAAIVSDAAGNFTLKGMSLFCLATAQLENGRAYPIDWSNRLPSGHTTGTYSVWFHDVQADAVSVVDDYNNRFTRLQFTDGVMRYYPVGNGHAYSFFAVWPRPTDMQYTATAVTGEVSFDHGRNDVVWGSADKQLQGGTAGADRLAYCAKYFRQEGKTTEIPVVNFRHATMQLCFTFQALPDELGSIAKAQELRIAAIRVHHIPTKGRIVVASSDAALPSGSIVCDWSDVSQQETVAIEDKAGTGLLTRNYYPTSVETAVGDSLRLPVPPENGYYTFEVDLADKAGRTYPAVIERKLQLKPGYTFQAGHSYTVNLLIRKLGDVTMQAKMAGWIEEHGKWE